MQTRILLGLGLCLALAPRAPAQTFTKTLNDIDFSRQVTQDEMIFAPFDWSDTEGFVWYTQYAYETTYSVVSAAQELNAAYINLLATAHTNNAAAYRRFIADRGITDTYGRIFDASHFSCTLTPEFSDFVKRISNKVPTVTQLGDMRNLCNVKFQFVKGWEDKINEFVQNKNVFVVDVQLPICAQSSPRFKAQQAVDPLVTKGSLEKTTSGFKGNLYSFVYDSVDLAKAQPSLFTENSKDTWTKFFSLFTIDPVKKEVSLPKESGDKLIKTCTPQPTAVTIGG